MSSHPVPDSTRNCSTIAALGMGPGLTTAELAAVRGSDIVVAADGLPVVRVSGPRARAVPVTAEWADVAMRLRGDDVWLLRPGASSRTTSVVTQTLLTSIGDIKPTPQRMRNTWLIDHMNAGTPARLIVELSGLKTADAIVRLLRYTSPLSDTRALRLARLASNS